MPHRRYLLIAPARGSNATAFLLSPALLSIALLAHATAFAGDDPQYEFEDIRILRAAADEPVREAFSLSHAADYLDRGAKAWFGARKCVSCHTNGTYLLVRPSLSTQLGPPPQSMRDDHVAALKQLAGLKRDELLKSTRPAQVIYAAAGLAQWDAHVARSLSDETDQALRLMFSLQQESGTWGTLDCWPPYESDAFHEATVAAIAAADAPGWLDRIRETPLRENVERLKQYLRTTEPPHDYGRVLLLWTSARMPGLLDKPQQEAIIDMIGKHQRADGGWSIRSFASPEAWGAGNRAKKLRSEPEFAEPPSDGHQTGMSLVALREAGVPADDPRIARGVEWLLKNQRSSGRWWTRSLNTDGPHFITYSGTAFPLLALKLCDALPGKEDRKLGAREPQGALSLRPLEIGDAKTGRIVVEMKNTGNVPFTWDTEFAALMKWEVRTETGDVIEQAIVNVSQPPNAEEIAKRFVRLEPGKASTKEFVLTAPMRYSWSARKAIAVQGDFTWVPVGGEYSGRFELPRGTEQFQVRAEYSGGDSDAADAFTVYVRRRPEDLGLPRLTWKSNEIRITLSVEERDAQPAKREGSENSEPDKSGETGVKAKQASRGPKAVIDSLKHRFTGDCDSREYSHGFRIRNGGDELLTIKSTAAVGLSPKVRDSVTIPVGGDALFVVTWKTKPDKDESFTGYLQLATNDPDKPSITLHVEEDVPMTFEQTVAELKKAVETGRSDSDRISADSLAIATEWVRMTDKVGEGRIRHKADSFVSFVNGRLKTTAPTWWTREIRRGSVFRGKETGFKARRLAKMWEGEPDEWQYNGIDSLEESPAGLVLEKGSHRVVLKRRDFPDVGVEGENWNHNFGAVAADLNEDNCAVAFECSSHGPGALSQLHFVEISTGKVLWKQELASDLRPGISYSGGYNGNFSQVVIDDDRVLLWNAHDVAVVCMAFRKSDGEPLAYFASTHLQGVSLKQDEMKKT